MHLAGLYAGAIVNSNARKLLPKYWNDFSSKKELAWKSHLEKKCAAQNSRSGEGWQFSGVDLVNLQVVGEAPPPPSPPAY